MNQKKPILCVVGLGYVGLPLAHAFARKGFDVIGYDVNEKRISELKEGRDWTNELTAEQLKDATIEYSADAEVIARANIVIVAVPTPIDEANNPDLTILRNATTTVGHHLQLGQIVVFESTVYPGTTEEICGAILERESGLTSGRDFTLGYSPERINPGDREHTVDKIIKVVAGQDEATTDTLSDLYGAIVSAGIHRAPSIKVAEMAKAIENAQRDLNIAFVNEVALLSHRIGISTKAVLEAAGTKWNFLRFQPGLVGGHCIGVDPYYLVEKARQLGMETHVISAGRSVNDSMPHFVADQIAEALPPGGGTILVLGITFKENIPDTRNSKVRDVIRALESHGFSVVVHDPFYDADGLRELGYQAASFDDGPFDAVALLVPHAEYLQLDPADIAETLSESGVVYDVKGIWDKAEWKTTQRYLSL